MVDVFGVVAAVAAVDAEAVGSRAAPCPSVSHVPLSNSSAYANRLKLYDIGHHGIDLSVAQYSMPTIRWHDGIACGRNGLAKIVDGGF